LLYHKTSRSAKALMLLNDIIKINEKDILAHKTKLEIFADIGNVDSQEAKETYEKIENLIKNGSFPKEIIFSSKFAIIRFLQMQGELLKVKGRSKEANEHFNKVVIPRFVSLINEISPNLGKLKAVVQNAYGCFLYDVLRRKEDGIRQLRGALESNAEHLESLHKLISIFLSDEINLKQTENETREHLRKILEIDSSHHAANRSLILLEVKLRKWAEADSEEEFWKHVNGIYRRFQDILEPEDGHLNFDNLITHHTAGCFLASAEAKAHKMGFLRSKPLELPSAEVEFRKGIDIEKYHIGIENMRRDMKRHLSLGYTRLGAYLFNTAKGNESRTNEGISFLKKGLKLGRKYVPDMLRKYFKKWMIKAPPVIGLMYIYYGFAPEDLLIKFENVDLSLQKLEEPFTKTLEELIAEGLEHRRFVAFLISTILQKRAISPKTVKEIVIKSGKIPSILRYANISELNKWEEIFFKLDLSKEAEKCEEAILTREPQSMADRQVFITKLLKKDKERALSLMEKWLE